MKTAEAKTASSALQKKAQKPFFGRGGDAMMVNEAPAHDPFFSNNPIQAKLTVGKPNDHYEKEADSMADKVVQRLSKDEISRSNSPSRISRCAECEAEEAEEKKEEKVQKKEQKTDAEGQTGLRRKPIFESDAETPVQKKAKKDSPLAQKSNKNVPLSATITPVSSVTPVQAKCSACEKEELQKKEGETEETEKLQRKPIFSSGAEDDDSIQRRCRECDEGDKVLMKPKPGIQLSQSDQTPNADGSRNSILAAAKGELGKVQARLNDGTGKRVGADRLLEYFHIAAPDVWQDSIIETAGAQMPSWCGIFSVWAHKKAGKDVGNWQMGKGVSAFGTLTQTDSPQPGDIGYIDQPNQHHAIVKEVAGDTIHTIDGNSGMNSEVIENSKPRTAYSGFLTAFGGGSASGNVQSKGEASQNHITEENAASDSVETRISSSRGKGSSLPADTRQDMEQSFGADFSNVRVHSDSNAAALSNDLHAHAFTQGSDIYFNSGMYDTGSNAGKRLLAHELTHVVQQGHAPDQVQRYSWDEFVEDVSDVADSAEEVIEETGEAIAETAGDVKDFVVETGSEAIEVVTDTASAALDWLKTTAGQAAKDLVEHLGGTLTITAAGIEISFGRNCFMEAQTHKPKLKGWKKEKLWYVAAWPVGPDLLLTGQLGFVINVDPKMEVQVGPACLEGFHLLINPLTSNYSISGSISTNMGVALAAEVRGGVKGQLGLTAIVPIPVPVPVTAPLVGLEGGIAGLVRGIFMRRMTIGGGLTYSGGTITASGAMLNEIGLGYDLFAGAYGQLDILGKKICRLYWEPLEKHGSMAYALGLSGDLTIVPGKKTTITPNLNEPTLDETPFDSLESILDRKGMSDDCPIKDKICEVLKALNLLPSQNGGKWDWAGTGHGGLYGPGSVLPGPNVVYQRNPGITSSALCRGACGPDCKTCTHHPIYTATDSRTGETWQYTNYEACKSNDGCREHDAAFDWAADTKGETGPIAIIMPWHMAANMECTCNNVAGNCIAWIAGLPPYDMDLNFADSAARITSGGGIVPGPGVRHSSEPIGEWGPDFYHYSVVPPTGNFSAGVERWTDYHTNCRAEAQAATGVPDNLGYITSLSDTVADQFIDRNQFSTRFFTSIIYGTLVPANHYTNHTEIPAGTYVTTTLDLFTPDCQPGTGPSQTSEEEELEQCDRGELPPEYCEELYNRIIERFGNSERDLNLDPDADPDEGRTRPDDAPIMSSFRRHYNRLDSWEIFIKTRHPDFYDEFNTRFGVKQKKLDWMAELKKRTKGYKARFRDARTQDTAALEKQFLEKDLTEIQGWISALNLEIANWYKAKTGSAEDPNAIIERVHAEGTELWRTAWRQAILAVNRVLARLWPPAKARIIGWVADQKNLHPGKDLEGDIGELDYIGSLATGYKGAPKQFARFNPDKFDVDGNVIAPPLEKFAVNIMGIVPDRGRIFAIQHDTGITPLITFCHEAQEEMKDIPGYDASEEFDVVIQATATASQQRSEKATERIYALRPKLGAGRYNQMVTELRTAGLLVDLDNSWQVKDQLSFAENVHLNAILRRYE